MQAVKEGDQIEFLRPIAGSVRNLEPSIDDAGVFRALRRRLDRRTVIVVSDEFRLGECLGEQNKCLRRDRNRRQRLLRHS